MVIKNSIIEIEDQLLNSTDVINRTEEDDGIVTYSYLKTSRMFEALN